MICNEKYDINNGLLLNTSLHKLFDEYLFSINPDTKRIEFNKKILNDVNYVNYTKYNNIILNQLTKKTCQYLENHYKKFVEIN